MRLPQNLGFLTHPEAGEGFSKLFHFPISLLYRRPCGSDDGADPHRILASSNFPNRTQVNSDALSFDLALSFEVQSGSALALQARVRLLDCEPQSEASSKAPQAMKGLRIRVRLSA